MKKVILGNWKENKNEKEVSEWLMAFKELAREYSGEFDVIVCPPFPYLPMVHEFAQDYDWFFVGAQDVSKFKEGSHTGEVSASEIAEFCTYCIVGHSERGEPLEVVKEKVTRLEEAKINPVVCFLKPEKFHTGLGTDAVLLWEDPVNISKDGKFNPRPADEVKLEATKIREKFDIKGRLIYGGSVNRQNAPDLCKLSELDGVVMGSASLDPHHFYEVISAFESCDT